MSGVRTVALDNGRTLPEYEVWQDGALIGTYALLNAGPVRAFPPDQRPVDVISIQHAIDLLIRSSS